MVTLLLLIFIANVVAHVGGFLFQAQDFLIQSYLLPNIRYQLLLLRVAVVEEALIVFNLVVDVLRLGVKRLCLVDAVQQLATQRPDVLLLQAQRLLVEFLVSAFEPVDCFLLLTVRNIQ